jgi:hypothetical protein
MVKRWPTALLTRAVQTHGAGGLPLFISSAPRGLIARSFEMRWTVPIPMPSDLATFKIPTPFAKQHRSGSAGACNPLAERAGKRGRGKYQEDRGGPRRPVDGGHVAAGDPDGFGTGEEFLRRPLDGSPGAKIKFKLGGTFQIFNPAFEHVR